MNPSVLLGWLLVCVTGVVAGCRFERLAPIMGSEGDLQSLNYPERYPPGACQLWSIHGPPGSVLTIKIVSLDLPTWSPKVCNDFLLIGPLPKKKYCGDSNTLALEPYTATLTRAVGAVFVLFNTTLDGEKGTGFYLQYILTNPNFPDNVIPPKHSGGDESLEREDVQPPKKTAILQPPPPPPPLVPTLDSKITSFSSPSCGHEITGFNGGISSNASMLGPLLTHGQCVWHVHPTVPSGMGMQTGLSFFTCELSIGDELRVYAGPSRRLLMTYTRDTCHGTLAGCGDDFFVVYKPSVESLRKYGVPDFAIVFSARLSCKKGYRRCGFLDNACFPSRKVCDGVRDCLSGSDEFDCRQPHSRVICQNGYINCGPGEDICYPSNKACDGVLDCPATGGDEAGCANACPPGQYSCHPGTKACFSESDRCNGKGDCKNYQDETNCTIDRCSPSRGLFLCDNGRCIYEKWRCDRTKDCADNTDEEGCQPAPSPRVIVAAVVGALTCSLVLVIALGCVCKLYNLRMQQLHNATGHHHHHRPDTPLTRLQAELFRRRAPPPPYNEAMLTSRPYDEAYQEVLRQAGLAYPGGDLNIPPSAARGSGRQRHTCRRHRRRNRRHRTLGQDLQESVAACIGMSSEAGFDDNLLLLSAEAPVCTDAGPTNGHHTEDGGGDDRHPPPYACVIPNLTRIPEESSSSNSDDEDEEEMAGMGGHDDDDDVPLLYLGSLTSTDMEMSTVAGSGGSTLTSGTLSSARTREVTSLAGTELPPSEDPAKDAETASTSLSVDSDPTEPHHHHHGGDGEGEEEEDKEEDSRGVSIIEEDSDSDCILAEADNICDDDDDDNDDDDEEEEEGGRDGDSDSDTAFLLA